MPAVTKHYARAALSSCPGRLVFEAIRERPFLAAIRLRVAADAHANAEHAPRQRRMGRLYGTGLLNNVLPVGLIGWGQHRIATRISAIQNAATALFAVLVAYAHTLADSEQTQVTWALMSGV